MKNNFKAVTEIVYRDINLFEWLTYMVILGMAMNAILESTRWWYLQKVFPTDFVLYFNASRGEYRFDWSYKEIVAQFFKLFFGMTGTSDNPTRAYAYWCGFQTGCWLIICHLMFKVKYGFIFVWATLKLFTDLLQVGNIQILCCLAAFAPLPSLLGGLVKPHYFVFSIGHALCSRYSMGHGKRKSINKA